MMSEDAMPEIVLGLRVVFHANGQRFFLSPGNQAEGLGLSKSRTQFNVLCMFDISLVPDGSFNRKFGEKPAFSADVLITVFALLQSATKRWSIPSWLVAVMTGGLVLGKTSNSNGS